KNPAGLVWNLGLIYVSPLNFAHKSSLKAPEKFGIQRKILIKWSPTGSLKHFSGCLPASRTIKTNLKG
ncbi:hypothetical protein, partial [Kingella denitrificans]